MKKIALILSQFSRVINKLTELNQTVYDRIIVLHLILVISNTAEIFFTTHHWLNPEVTVNEIPSSCIPGYARTRKSEEHPYVLWWQSENKGFFEIKFKMIQVRYVENFPSTLPFPVSRYLERTSTLTRMIERENFRIIFDALCGLIIKKDEMWFNIVESMTKD